MLLNDAGYVCLYLRDLVTFEFIAALIVLSEKTYFQHVVEDFFDASSFLFVYYRDMRHFAA